MVKTVYIIENLGCANCAAKMEEKINGLPQVQEATITFATRQLRLTAEDPDGIAGEIQALMQTVEPDVTIHKREESASQHDRNHTCGCSHHHDHAHECGCGHHHAHGHECGCEHHHDHDHECGCGHHHEHGHECGCAHHHGHNHGEEGHEQEGSFIPIALGTGLFVLGLAAGRFGLSVAAGLVYIAAYLLLGRNVLQTAVKNMVSGHIFDENFLMSIATIGAFLIGEFPEAVGVMLFYRVGEYFEHRAVARSRSQIMEAVDLRPEVVTLVTGEHTRSIPAADARVGDILLVHPGDRIPLDGIVLTGESRIDTAPITGEPVPVHVRPGSSLISGCVNTESLLTMQVEKPLSESMVTRILDSVENAAASKPKIDRFITRFARIYTPVVVAIAAATALIPSVVTGEWHYWVYTALSFLVMSCPCALVLSVPLAFFSGIGVGSKQGILFKGGLSIEALAKVTAVAMDKTGTLTKGDFSVQAVEGPEEMLALCASCEQFSTHPIAVSITAEAMARGIALTKPETLEEFSGRGIRATLNGRTVLCGNARLLEENGIAVDKSSLGAGGTVVLAAVDGFYWGSILISDTVKADARSAVTRLRELGVATAMLTGDDSAAAEAVSKSLGLEQTYARLLPDQKLDTLRSIRECHGSVMFVGDGINDAPVLSGADVGAAMGSGADAAIEAADVVFMTGAVEAIPESISIARRTQRTAWQNVVFALAIKFIVMALGLLGHASMWLAVFADSGVAMLCVLNSVRMLYKNQKA